MSSHIQQNKILQHRNSPMEGYCEDYNGYAIQNNPNERLSPKDALSRNQQVKQTQTKEKSKAAEYMAAQADRSGSLEYVQWQEKKNSLNHQDASPSHNFPKGLFDGIGSNKFNGSLESLPGDNKNRDKLQLPTFGEDQFNNVVASQQANSPKNKNPNMSKIDQMLEQHKKRKALQQFNDLKNETDNVSPILEKTVLSKDSDNIPRLFKDHELYAHAIEGEWREGGHSRDRQSFGAQSFGVEGSRHGSNPSGQYDRKGLVDFVSESASSAEETGRFKWSPRLNEIAEANKIDSNREIIEEKIEVPTSPTTDRKSNRSSSRNTTVENSSLKNKTKANVPTISENSKKIFKNSQRAKEDEQMRQELLAMKIRQLSSIESRDPNQLQRIPEENESLDKSKFSQNGSPQSKQKLSQLDTEENQGKLAWSLMGEGLMNENVSGQRARITPETHISRLTLTEDSPKRQANFEIPNTFPYTNNANISIRGTTVVEHKKPGNPVSYRKDENTGRESSPNKQELKELVKAPKQIYLKMVDNTVNPLNSRDSSPRRKNNSSPRRSAKTQQEPSSPESPSKSVQKDKKVYDKITPEELEKYDEVQRLEVILSNLQHIQRSNLLAQIHALRLKNPKSGDFRIPAAIQDDWSQYAVDINNNAMDIRTSRKNKSEEKFPRAVKSVSPKRMEKVDVSVESFCNSALLRERLAIQTNVSDEANSIKNIWRHENGLKKHWENDNVYDRNQKWLLVKKYKLNQLNDNLSTQEMKDCSFKPIFFTKVQNSRLSSPQRSNTETSNGNINSLSERLPIPREQNNAEVQALVSDRNLSEKNKSLYKERKNQESYTGLFDLKKSYNLYKNESLGSKKNEAFNSIMSNASETRRKDIVN